MADIWNGFAADDKYWAQEKEAREARYRLAVDLLWIEFRTHTSRVATFFVGANMGRKAFVK